MKTMTQEIIVRELQKFIEESIIDQSVELDENKAFRDLGVDSFSVIQIVLFIERKFDVAMEESDLTPENLQSIHSLSQFVLTHQ